MYALNRLLPVLAALFGTAEPRFNLRIVHVNDVHSHVAGISREFASCGGGPECYGGFPRMFRRARELIDADPEHTLWLNGGDNFQGTAYYTFFKSAVLVELLNPMQFDAIALGNHEFDDGVPEAVKFMAGVTAPFVCANLDVTGEPTMLNGTRLSNWIMVEKSGVKIGIVGYITTETKFTSRPGHVTFLNDVESVRKYAREAKAQGAQIVIALGHSGYIVDQDIARVVEEVDIVVGAHSHTFLYTGTPPDPLDVPMGPYPTWVTQENTGKSVPVVQAFKYTKYLGYFEVNFDDAFRVMNTTGQPILLSPDLPEDPEIKSILSKWEKKLTEHIPANEVLTDVQQIMRIDDCRFAECELGNMITDAMVETICEDYSACIGLYNGGAIRASVKKGNLTTLELLDTIPFNNEMLVLQMDGAFLLEMLEMSVGYYDATRQWPKGGFLQMSGLKVVYDVTKPYGSRVEKAEARTANPDKYEEVVRGRPYNIVTSSYLYGGGDNYTIFRDHGIKPNHEYNRSDFEVVSTYLGRRRTFAPRLEGRIVVKDGVPGSGQSIHQGLILIAALVPIFQFVLNFELR